MLHSSLNCFKILLKRKKIIFLIKAPSHPPPPKNLRPNKGFNAHNNMIRKTRKIKKQKRKRKGHSLRGMRHYLWSARCNTVSVNFTQKWQK